MPDKPLPRHLHEQNRISWNAATDAHNSHKDDQAGFLRERGHTLFPEELELLGDLHGKKLAHLQCNAGQDTLSLAKFGAIVTGVDISDTAIDFACQLSKDSGIPAKFICSDVYDWLDQAVKARECYDIVFSSYGAICWLSDLSRWAERIGRILIPGGRLVLVDFHPIAMIFEEDWSIQYDYFTYGEPKKWDDGIGDYVAVSGSALSPMGNLEGVKDFVNPHPCHEWIWTIGDILESVIHAGLTLNQFREYPYLNGEKGFKDMIEKDGRRMYPPANLPSLPLMYG
ncbi:MAG: class I SAM-dependent methyltransferase, partial [Anaerolineaceae bacterium]|nr:class I SAM-dependent methyltransferase [Anaerolineaceae bacterium]